MRASFKKIENNNKFIEKLWYCWLLSVRSAFYRSRDKSVPLMWHSQQFASRRNQLQELQQGFSHLGDQSLFQGRQLSSGENPHRK